MEKKEIFSIKQKERVVVITSINHGDEKIYRVSSRNIDHEYHAQKIIEELLAEVTYDNIVSINIQHVSIIDINNSISVKYRGYWIFDHGAVNNKVMIVGSQDKIDRATVSRFADDINHALDIIDESFTKYHIYK